MSPVAKKAMTRSPSVTGVGAAMLVLGWHRVEPVAQNWRSQSFLPDFSSKQRTCSRFWLCVLLAVR